MDEDRKCERADAVMVERQAVQSSHQKKRQKCYAEELGNLDFKFPFGGNWDRM